MGLSKKYQFQTKERHWQRFWEGEKIYRFHPFKKGKVFSIDTPPPTLSGKMHLGHAFSYTHQDIIVRYHRMKGENVFYPFGVDDNGLPTEKLVEKINKIKLFDLSREEFIKICYRTIKKILPQFIYDWKRIGISCDFSHIYSTNSKEVRRISQFYFLELVKKGRIIRKEMPTLFCPGCQTAIAQAELEDKEKESTFNDIVFRLENGKKITISTTRPELLASCVAVFVHPDDKKYKKLIGKRVIVPIFGQRVKIFADKKVDPKKGTGVVMCCTFGDTTDVKWYFEYNLPLRISISKEGKMTKIAQKFASLPIKEAREKILQELKEKGLLLNQRKIIHTVNVHERCGFEVEILPTSQWFIKYLDLKKEFLEQSKKLNWYPKHMRARLDNWIRGLSWDWCISRQRYFGIPIPVWYCKNCQKIILPEAKDLPLDPLSSQPKKRCDCGSKEFIPEKDVLDTWATSSLTPQIVLSLIKNKKLTKKMFPLSLRPQARDIINFWLFYTLARSWLHFKKVPFFDVVVSGFVLNQKGEKMSKSKGNAVEPETVLKNYGADVLRFWAGGAFLGEDLKYSQKELKRGKRTVIKIWNASRFSLLHLKNYSPQKTPPKNLADQDKWILTKLYRAIAQYTKEMDRYQYAKAREIIERFFWKDFCDNYLEIVKLRVYGKDDQGLKAAQFTLYYTLLAILKLYAPIIPFVVEEIYQSYFRKFEKKKSIHLTLLPKLDEKLYFPKIASDFELAIDAIAQIRKYKAKHRLSMKTQIEKVVIKTKNKARIKKYLPLIEELMSVKNILPGGQSPKDRR
jgi:valyl-tRNA synthetase